MRDAPRSATAAYLSGEDGPAPVAKLDPCGICTYRHPANAPCLSAKILPPGVSSEDHDHPWVARAQRKNREAVDARKRLRLQRAGRKGAEAKNALRARERSRAALPATPQRDARLRREGWRSDRGQPPFGTATPRRRVE